MGLDEVTREVSVGAEDWSKDQVPENSQMPSKTLTVIVRKSKLRAILQVRRLF